MYLYKKVFVKSIQQYIINQLQNPGLSNINFMKLFTTRIFLILLALFTLSNCQTIETRGQLIDDSLLPQLENKKLHKEQVTALLGTPTITPDYAPNSWYYVQRTLASRAWFAPRVIEQKIIKIKFNKKNMVEEVIAINDMHKENIVIVSDYTKTYGTELNGVQKFVKNIGRFNKTTDSKKKKKKIKSW